MSIDSDIELTQLTRKVLDPDPDLYGFAVISVAGSGYGSRRAKITYKNRKK
jgi:hypothetical protein